MKKYLPIFAIIALVVFVAGCVDSGTTNNTTSVNTTVPDVPSKTYAKNGISFKYPQSWTNQLEIQTPNVITGVGDPDSKGFQRKYKYTGGYSEHTCSIWLNSERNL